MKTLLILTICICFFSFTSLAKIWRVNNNTGIDADFTTLQAAHDSASAGDTIHLEPSPTAYNGATIRKKLVILGNGFYLNENPKTQANPLTSLINGLTLYAGAAGTVIMGLDFNANSLNVYANDIVIRRNKFSQTANNTPDYYTGIVQLYYNYEGDNTPIRNIIISQNYGLRIDVNYPSTGILISNNFISYYSYAGENTTGASLFMHANAIGIIQNNIIRRGKVTIRNSTITNNIMVAGSFEGSANLVANNLANASQFGTANGNKENVDMATVFIGAGTDISSDGRWALAAGSPAIGAGYGSTTNNPVDAGIFSGQTPYVLSGLPPMPSVYYFENKPIGSNNDPITVTIKVKSNN